MNFYKISIFCLASEVEFPELIPIEGDVEAVDITVRLGTVEAVDTDAVDCDTVGSRNLIGRIPHVAKFSFVDGCEITVEPLSHVDEALLRTTILGPALCLLLEQRGLLVLHASCININHQAVAFMGGSGWGKSTLATAFHRKGYDALTDDVMPLSVTQNQALVLPSYPQFKVAPEALASLGADVDRLSPVYKDCGKLSYRFAKGFQKEPLPLRRVYVLRKGDRHEITPATRQEAFSELIRHTRTIDLLKEHKDLISQHFQLCTQLIQQVSFGYFTRKPALEDLPKLVALVEDDIAKLSSHDLLTPAR
ncbi:MAG: hypothetical protein HC800_20840 [Phormidesmis sp. RL_2_1]|nr:hypothetical protein [Phormidesmis sp. RL_2_1]